MAMSKAASKMFTAALQREGSWGATALGTFVSTMTLYLEPDRRRGFIEWDIPDLDHAEEIGLWFEDNELTDYDGVMSLPREAMELLRENGFIVGADFDE